MSVAAKAQRGCSRCESPLEDGDLRCAVCALPVPRARAEVDRPRVLVLRCTWCGAAIAFDAVHGAPCCGFCRSVMKVEQPVDPVESATSRAPFLVDRDVATAALRTWLGKRRFFAPKALRDEAVLESLTPLCWAAWLVNADATVAWTADSDAGHGRSAWAPHAGRTRMTFSDIVVPASRGLCHDECSLLVPYDLSELVAVDDPAPGDDGPVVDDAMTTAMIERFDAQRSAARKHVQRAIQALARSRVEELEVPGSRFRNVRVACLLERQTTQRVALPAWVLGYRYRGSPYRAIVHGQRPEVVIGSSPIDWTKVARLVAAVAVAIVAILAVVVLLTR
jgi:hypothetical protein